MPGSRVLNIMRCMRQSFKYCVQPREAVSKRCVQPRAMSRVAAPGDSVSGYDGLRGGQLDLDRHMASVLGFVHPARKSVLYCRRIALVDPFDSDPAFLLYRKDGDDCLRHMRKAVEEVLQDLGPHDALARDRPAHIPLVRYIDQLGNSLQGMTCVVSGSGDETLRIADKLVCYGAKPTTLSDPSGFIHEPKGFTHKQLAHIIYLKKVAHRRISEYLQHSQTATFHEGQKPWGMPCDIAFPSATTNEINGEDAAALVKNGAKGVFEGVGMASTPDAIHCFGANEVVYAPSFFL
eukprot:gnl/TRDRNA2_/TRDRNA2_41912_c0_seq1.p1 gnl/TRDRNA2_/TRDRNA2_41912_c0~~gnl/TRDRNA2_/TRDRNA2_41912_c0_seq1.p1  ORF type:complete len:304 (-),score=36.02 gnl/TRDRNA2_/TRDRNA2_41912_c0_seq1:108-983(-)